MVGSKDHSASGREIWETYNFQFMALIALIGIQLREETENKIKEIIFEKKKPSISVDYQIVFNDGTKWNLVIKSNSKNQKIGRRSWLSGIKPLLSLFFQEHPEKSYPEKNEQKGIISDIQILEKYIVVYEGLNDYQPAFDMEFGKVPSEETKSFWKEKLIQLFYENWEYEMPQSIDVFIKNLHLTTVPYHDNLKKILRETYSEESLRILFDNLMNLESMKEESVIKQIFSNIKGLPIYSTSFLEALHVKEGGPFQELDINFNDRFNFVIGPNGSGKTSMLKCIAIALKPQQLGTMRFGTSAEIWIDFTYNNKKLRLGFDKGGIEEGNAYMQASFMPKTPTPPSEGERTAVHHESLEQESIFFVPLIMGAYRKVDYRVHEGTKRDATPEKHREEYRLEMMKDINRSNLPNVKQWIINRFYQFGKKWAIIESQNWLWFVKNLPLVGPSGNRLEFVEVTRDNEIVFNLFGNECFLEELSAGYQSVLALIVSIFNWIEQTHSDGQNKIVESATGTVFIDELDIHLHPEWQFTIQATLEKIFPKLQFIATSHSPYLILNSKRQQVIILPSPQESNGKIRVSPTLDSYEGYTIGEVLQYIMGVNSITNSQYEQLVTKAYAYVDSKDIGNLQEIIKSLQAITHSNNTIVDELKMILSKLTLEKTWEDTKDL